VLPTAMVCTAISLFGFIMTGNPATQKKRSNVDTKPSSLVPTNVSLPESTKCATTAKSDRMMLMLATLITHLSLVLF